MDEGRLGGPYCESCGHALEHQGANFCPSCGAAQSPAVEIPQGPPPGIPETGRIQTAEVPLPPPPGARGEGRTGSLWGRFLALSTTVKVIIGLAALGAVVLLSPVLGALATLAFLFSVVAAIVKVLRGRPAWGWGMVAIASIPLILVSTGISNAVYGPSDEAPAPDTIEQERTEP